MKNIQQVVEVLRKQGFKITPQRIAILEILEGNTSHPSAEDIYGKLVEKYPSISLTTVYNTLETLRDIGEIQELTIDKSRRHYDPNIDRHHHVICINCGYIGDIFADFSQALQVPKDVSDQFAIVNHTVQFYGLCTSCKDVSEA
jgi:Fur family peroxide stress response transcriptional regulator